MLMNWDRCAKICLILFGSNFFLFQDLETIQSLIQRQEGFQRDLAAIRGQVSEVEKEAGVLLRKTRLLPLKKVVPLGKWLMGLLVPRPPGRSREQSLLMPHPQGNCLGRSKLEWVC